MEKTLILHIGMPKTGTSTIQDMFKENVKELKKFNIAYPLFKEYEKLYPHKMFYSTGNGNLLAYAMRKEQEDNVKFPSFDSVVNDIINLINKSSSRYTIISHEDLLYMHPNLIEKMVDKLKENNIEIRCIFYIREQVSFHISNYQQHIKQIREKFTFKEYLTSRMEYVNYKLYTDKWGKYIEKKNFIVKLLDKNCVKKNIAIHFLESSGIPCKDIKLNEVKNSNVGLGKLATEMLRLANSKDLNNSEYEAVKKFVYSNLLMKIDEKLSIDLEEEKYIKDYYFKSNGELAGEYLTDEEKEILLK